MTEWIIRRQEPPEGLHKAWEALDAVAKASAASMAAMELALAMVWHCLDCDLREMAGRVETHHDVDAFGWRSVVVDGRVIHRQRWEQVGEYTWRIRQEWCPMGEEA